MQLYFGKHEVFVDCCHSNTAIYNFSVFFFKTVKILLMEQISVLILVLMRNVLFCDPYVTMPNVSLTDLV